MLNPISYSSGLSKLGCLRSDSKHRPNTLPGIVKQVRAKSSMPEVIVKDSLRRMIQVLMFLLLSGNVSTGFPVNSYGDIVWDEVSEKAPIDSAATEGRRTYWLGWLAGLGFLSYFLCRLFNLFSLVVQQYPKL